MPVTIVIEIAWESFTPYSALFGGVIIGLATTMFLLLNGRIAGISGILGGLFRPMPGDILWRVAFILGLIAAPTIWSAIAPMPAPQIDAGYGTLILAGLLVGVGTRFGSGCTSGHGVCGLSRFSLRSLVATISFMATGFAMVFVVRHAFGS